MNEQDRFRDKQWSLIVAKAWADEGFKGRLMADPKAVFRDHGVAMGPDIDVAVVEAGEPESTDRALRFVLPASPAGDLSEEELGPVSVAYCYSGGCFRCGRCGCGGCGRCGCEAL